MIAEARKKCKAPDNAGVVWTDYPVVAFPVFNKPIWVPVSAGFLPTDRPLFGRVLVDVNKRLAYGYHCGYSAELNILVIRQPRTDSTEAIGL